jgi:hypothetical protein
MKKKIFYLLSTCFLFACSDNSGLIPDGKDPKPLVPVSFNVGFTKEVIPLRSTSSSSEVPVEYLEYQVYDNTTGALYKRLIYTNPFTTPESDPGGELNFLLLEDQLPEGDYTIVFLACGTTPASPHFFNEGNIISSSLNPYFELFNFYVNEFNYGGPEPNQFFKKINCVVETGQYNDSEVVLERIVGKVEIVIEDFIPLEISTFEVDISDWAMWYCFSKTTEYSYGPTMEGIDRSFIPRNGAISGYTITFFAYENVYYLQERKPRTIALKFYNGGIGDHDSPAVEKVFYGVDVVKNKIVRYTGKLFGVDMEDSSFTLSVHDMWDETIEIPF